MLSHPTRKEIEECLEFKTLAFAQEESTRLWLSTKNWLDRYMYLDINEIFFVKFPIVLHEWLSILATRQIKF